jgi:GxxExxY protein
MPISIETELVRPSQQEFSRIAFDVMAEIFSIHNTLGRLFDEKVYKNALAERVDAAQSEVPIHISYRDFNKTYFMDLLIAKGAVFELKAANAINARHRSQLLNYLLLAELPHGKLVNLRSESVEHEFANTTLTHTDRIMFGVDYSEWDATEGFDYSKRTLIADMMKDWGTGLDIALYREAIHHFCGTKKGSIPVCLNGKYVSNQTMDLCDSKVAMAVTTFETISEHYQKHLTRLIHSTPLDAIHWINISQNTLTFKTLN